MLGIMAYYAYHTFLAISFLQDIRKLSLPNVYMYM